MPAPLNPVVVIPARLQAKRLPGKPLLDIHGDPMIVHVWRRAVAAAIGPVVVACGEQEIADAVTRAGGNAILTRSDHVSASNRVFEAVERFDPEGHFDAVINLHGDLPSIAPAMIRVVFTLLDDPLVDIATLVAEITADADRVDPTIAKVVIVRRGPEGRPRALFQPRRHSHRRRAAVPQYWPFRLSPRRVGALRRVAAGPVGATGRVGTVARHREWDENRRRSRQCNGAWR